MTQLEEIRSEIEKKAREADMEIVELTWEIWDSSKTICLRIEDERRSDEVKSIMADAVSDGGLPTRVNAMWHEKEDGYVYDLNTSLEER